MLITLQHHYRSLTVLQRILPILCLTLLFNSSTKALSQNKTPYTQKTKYYTIYLLNNKVCKKCSVQQKDADHVWLINKGGAYELVPINQIIGIDRHPIIRRLVWKSLHGIGLPGPVIAPEAFKNGNDFVCKYCDDIDR